MSYSFVGIDHVQLAAPAGCEPAARAFYGSLLGWEQLPKPEALKGRGGVWFQCGNQQVHIGVQRPFTAAAKAHPAFRVSGIAALRSHLQHNGVQVVDDDLRTDEGAARFYVNDPFGNRIEFIEWL